MAFALIPSAVVQLCMLHNSYLLLIKCPWYSMYDLYCIQHLSPEGILWLHPSGYNSSIYVKLYGNKSFSCMSWHTNLCIIFVHAANCQLLIPCHCTRCRFLFPGIFIDSAGQGRHPGNYPHLGASLSFWHWCCWRFKSDATRPHIAQGCSCWMFMYPSVVTTPCIKCMPLCMVSHCHWQFWYTAGGKFS